MYYDGGEESYDSGGWRTPAVQPHSSPWGSFTQHGRQRCSGWNIGPSLQRMLGMGTTGAMLDARAEFERLRAEHVELKREFTRLRHQWPVDLAAHTALLGHLAAHRHDLRQWRQDVRTVRHLGSID